jgi:predicted negative regulator of RcsB-dependent stress response
LTLPRGTTMPGMWWVAGVVVAVALLSAYLLWTAHRVERVHVRAQSAERALDAHLMRRAAAAAVVAEQRDDDELYAAARAALDAAPDERESAENDLTRQLQTVTLDAADAAARTLVATSRRVVLARQVHTDLVRDALTSRQRILVRVLMMARRYPRPQYFDIVEPVKPEPLMAPAVVPAEAI